LVWCHWNYVVKRYNIAVESVQKETASLLKRDCRARATHPSAVDYMSEIAKKAARARWGISQSG
jgi:TATA-binding protein-associated factor Taf7